MSNMKSQYGPEKAKEVFYATANKRKQNPGKAANPNEILAAKRK